MKIDLKSIQYAAFSSEETNCYSASLHVNGRKIGTVSNDGRGGCDRFHGDHAAYRAADDWCRANLPKWTGFDGEALDTGLEHHCVTLVDDWLAARHLRSALRMNVVFVHPDDGRLYQVRHRGKPEATISAVERQHPGSSILNSQPFDAALAVYRAGTAP